MISVLLYFKLDNHWTDLNPCEFTEFSEITNHRNTTFTVISVTQKSMFSVTLKLVQVWILWIVWNLCIVWFLVFQQIWILVNSIIWYKNMIHPCMYQEDIENIEFFRMRNSMYTNFWKISAGAISGWFFLLYNPYCMMDENMSSLWCNFFYLYTLRQYINVCIHIIV